MEGTMIHRQSRRRGFSLTPHPTFLSFPTGQRIITHIQTTSESLDRVHPASNRKEKKKTGQIYTHSV
jgi:hypothetical protein